MPPPRGHTSEKVEIVGIMSPSTGTRIAVWDGWRGLAISLVLVGHFTFSQWVWEERMGVDVFFVLSGMLMSNILFIDRMYLKDFYIRRFSRVVPALVVFLCASFAVGLLMKYDFRLIEFVAKLFFIRAYFPAEPAIFASELPTGHLWSLNAEEHSYILMSLISVVLLARFKIAYALLALFVFSVLVNIRNYTSMPVNEFMLTLFRTETTLGFIVFAAAYNLIKKELSISLHPVMPLVLFALAFFCYLKSLPVWLTFTFAPVFLGVAVNHLTQSASWLQNALAFAPLRWLGILSYSIYLWQQIFYKLHYALPGKTVTGLVLSIIAGVGSFFIIENPLRRYINKRWCQTPRYRHEQIEEGTNQ